MDVRQARHGTTGQVDGDPEAVVHRIDAVLRWAGAVGVVLGPLGVFVLPGMLFPSDDDTAEEQFRTVTEGFFATAPLLIQVSGAVSFVFAALGIGGYAVLRRRGRAFATGGLIIGLAGALSALVALGIELGTTFLLYTAADEATIELALALNSWPLFVGLLTVALGGIGLSLVLLGVALWRAGVIPFFVPLLFFLPLVIGLLPFTSISNVIAASAFLVPCVWIAVQLLRRPRP